MNSKRVIAALTILSIISIIIFLGHESAHVCTCHEEDCGICAEVKLCIEVEHALIVCLVVLAVGLKLNKTKLAPMYNRTLVFLSPIDLKVEMLD